MNVEDLSPEQRAALTEWIENAPSIGPDDPLVTEPCVILFPMVARGDAVVEPSEEAPEGPS